MGPLAGEGRREGRRRTAGQRREAERRRLLAALRGDISLGTFLAFATYLAALVSPVRQLAALLTIGQQARAGVERVLEIIDARPALVSGTGALPEGPLTVELDAPRRFAPDTPLTASKNYLDLKHAATGALPPGVHFKLVEAVADHICETLFLQDRRVRRVTVKIVKLAISEAGEAIGITLVRHRP